MRRVLIAAGLLAALAPAAPAHAAAARTGVVAHHVDVDRLRLAGGSVLIGNATSRRETVDVAARGRRPRRVAALTAGPPGGCTGDSGDFGIDAGFDATAQALAVSSVCSADAAPTMTRVVAAATGQAPVQLASCSTPGLLRAPVAVTGTRVVYVDECTPGGASLVVHDLAGGADRRIALPAAPQQYFGASEVLQAAGPFVADDLSSDAQPAAGVLDLRTGEQRMVPLDGAATITDMAVDSAGSVLVRREVDGRCGVVELYAPGAASPRVLEPCADDAGIGLVDGRAAYFAARQLHVGDRVLANLPEGVAAAHLAFDGAQAAYDVPECGGRRDVVLVAATGPAPALRRNCPFSIPPQLPALTGSHITVRARCPSGCADADMLLVSADGHRRPLAVYTRPAEAGAVQKLTAGAATVRAIGRRGRLEAILRVGVRRLDGRYRFRERRVAIVAAR